MIGLQYIVYSAAVQLGDLVLVLAQKFNKLGRFSNNLILISFKNSLIVNFIKIFDVLGDFKLKKSSARIDETLGALPIGASRREEGSYRKLSEVPSRFFTLSLFGIGLRSDSEWVGPVLGRYEADHEVRGAFELVLKIWN